MKRRVFVQQVGALGLVAGGAACLATRSAVGQQGSGSPGESASNASASTRNPLKTPDSGRIPVAFLISDGAVVIDFCGPWEVFQDAVVIGHGVSGFTLYTVAETTAAVRASGGMRIVPDYSFANAPMPRILVIPAQSGANEPTKDWIRKVTRTTDVTMSVCNGAFVLASTGLLSGRSATAHHSAYRDLAMAYPDVNVRRGARFVEDGNLATAGGLTSGIDLALRVVERYFGREAARKTAYAMEYQGQGWLNADSNAVYATARVSTDANPLCPVCWMDVDPATSPRSTYAGKTYLFCTPAHKQRFDASPATFLTEPEAASDPTRSG